MSHRKPRWTCVAAALALAWGDGAWADDTGCAEVRAAYESLKGMHEELRAEYGLQTGVMILSIPSFSYQMTPKISLNIRCSISICENFSINGRTRPSDQLGMCSYNINP